MKKGKIIVFEGLDHSFKETNAKALYDYIKENITDKVILLSFPNYESTSSKFVVKYLKRQYGELAQVNPYTRCMFYAVDRYDSISEMDIHRLLVEGYYIIMDRYTTSNLLFGSAEYEDNEDKDKFIDWSIDFEYNKNNLPKEDIVIYMNMPTEIAFELIKKRDNVIDNDIHENDNSYLKKVENNALNYICDKLNWNIVDCVKDDQIRSEQDIFNNILTILKNNNIF